MRISFAARKNTRRIPSLSLLIGTVLIVAGLCACTPSYLQDINDGASCPYAVRMAIRDGDKSTEALLTALKNPKASELAVDALFNIATNHTEYTSEENERAQQILIRLYRGECGQKYIDQILYDMMTNSAESKRNIHQTILEEYAKKPSEERLTDLQAFFPANILGYIDDGRALQIAAFYGVETDPQIKQWMIQSILTSYQSDAFFPISSVLESFLHAYADSDNAIVQTSVPEILREVGVPGEVAVLGGLYDNSFSEQERAKFGELYSQLLPAISKSDIVACLKSDIEEEQTCVENYLSRSADAAYLDDLLAFASQNASDDAFLSYVTGILINYAPDDRIAAFEVDLLAKLPYVNRDRSTWFNCIDYLSKGVDDSFAESLVQIAQSYENNEPAYYKLSSVLANVEPNQPIIDYWAGMYGTLAPDSAAGDLLRDSLATMLKDVPLKGYLDGYRGKAVDHTDKNKVAVIKIDDKVDGTTEYSVSPLTFLVVPAEKRVTLDQLYTAGTVIYLHYYPLNGVSYSSSDSTVTGYETDCALTKVDLSSGTKLAEEVWHGDSLAKMYSLNDTATDFAAQNNAVEHNPEQFLDFIGG